ncbi:MAG: hypothetical protein CL663_06930 [Bacteroidetes bacterium]|nr:hypothetical protein [Bacteroidota bacterium]|tara:strand:- start:67 stop:570 length:504 start_codon:yes stop_codon:yes gene_type:complete
MNFMKKILLALAVVLLTAGYSYSQVNFGLGAVAGTQSGIKTIDTENLNFGLHARLAVDLTNELGIIGGATYYLPADNDILGGSVERDLFQFNADLTYNVLNEGPLRLYGLGGLVFSSDKRVEVGQNSNTDTEIGWEAGGGVKISRFFAEVKWDNREQQVVGVVGIYF